MKKILIATDGSTSSAEAVEFGVELAAEQKAKVVFVHVAPSLDVVPVVGYGIGGGGPRVPHALDEFDRFPLARALKQARSSSSETQSMRSSPTPTRRAST